MPMQFRLLRIASLYYTSSKFIHSYMQIIYVKYILLFMYVNYSMVLVFDVVVVRPLFMLNS